MELLSNIQNKLKCDKGQYNDFGKYKYRSCEDILEALKPVLASFDCSVTVSDDIVLIGDRYYVKATVTLFAPEGLSVASVTAFAREQENKKGMDYAQITGAASSYARKYALNGLFAIDDTKDADTVEAPGGPKATATKSIATWSYCIANIDPDKRKAAEAYIAASKDAIIDSFGDVYVFSKNMSKLQSYKITRTEVEEARVMFDNPNDDVPDFEIAGLNTEDILSDEQLEVLKAQQLDVGEK